MATSLEALDAHMLAGILVDYEENLDHNRLAAQIDDIVELQNRLIPELKVTDDGSIVSEPFGNFELTDSQREILSRALAQRAVKIEAHAQELLDGLERLRARF